MKKQSKWTVFTSVGAWIILCLFMGITLQATDSLPGKIKAGSKGAEIREKPEPSATIIANVGQNVEMVVTGKNNDWFQVSFKINDSSKSGYVLQSSVTAVTEPPQNSSPSSPGNPNQTVSSPPSTNSSTISTNSTTSTTVPPHISSQPPKKKDHFFLMGMGMLRINWTDVKGDDLRFKYSDLGLPTDFSTRERASFMMDGTFGHGKYDVDGHVNYDPETRTTEPPLEFLINVGNNKKYLSVGDYQIGVMMDSVFSRYYHPFRGAIAGIRSNRMGIEFVGGLSRGESGIEEIPADAGSGPYYIKDSPILRSSETIFLVIKSNVNPDLELKRIPMVRNRDYFIDYDRGAILFNYTIYPYDESGNPISILATYQFESLTGHFSRAVFGVKAFAIPTKILKLTFDYIGDSDKDQNLGDIFKNARGIYSFGVNVDSKPVTFFGEYSISSEPLQKNESAFFGGGIWSISKKLHLFVNGWSLDDNFSTFANKQLQYGYSLFQIFPSYATRNIYLSPFQFTRNLGAELYPFTLSRLSVDENEIHGFMEWDNKNLKLSAGYGTRKEISTRVTTDTLYVSSFLDTAATKAWGKVGADITNDPGKTKFDNRESDILVGARQKVMKFANGNIFVQGDYGNESFTDDLDLSADTRHQSYSIFTEYLTGSEGVFAGYRKEILTDKNDNHDILNNDIFEVGVRRHVYKGLFLDSRYRKENGEREGVKSETEIISLGAGIESQKVRAMARYEIQINDASGTEGRRRLLSFYFFGAPFKRISINFRYYKQLGKETSNINLNERSEEELTFRLLWRPWDFLNLYSQWRYDTNLELYPPLDRTKSNSLASIQGLKLTISKRLEFLANYKLIKVWGPIDNKKFAASAEAGYLLFRHLRVGIGVERFDYRDPVQADANYKTTVGYLKLVALY